MNQWLYLFKWIAVAASLVMFQNGRTPSQAGETGLRVAEVLGAPANGQVRGENSP